MSKLQRREQAPALQDHCGNKVRGSLVTLWIAEA